MKRLVWILLLLLQLGINHLSQAQKIGLLLDNYVIDRWYKDQKHFTEHVKELGGECVVEVAHGDAVEQVRLGKKMIADGVSVLVIVATDGQRAAEIIPFAKAAGVPVVAYDRLILSNDLDFFISYNSLKIGTQQAEYALSKVKTGSYMIINGPTSDNNSALYKKGQMSVLQPQIASGKIKIVADFVLNDWSEMEAVMRMNEFLSSNAVPDAIIATNDAIATGVIQALPPEKAGKVVVTGMDADLLALKNIVGGHQSMTIYKPIKPLAHQAAEIAIKLSRKEEIKGKMELKNGTFSINAILLDPMVVDQNNYKDTVIKDGHVSEAELSHQ